MACRAEKCDGCDKITVSAALHSKRNLVKIETKSRNPGDKIGIPAFLRDFFRKRGAMIRIAPRTKLRKSAVILINTELFQVLRLEISVDEAVNIAVHDRVDVAGFKAGAVIFGERIGHKNIGANL